MEIRRSQVWIVGNRRSTFSEGMSRGRREKKWIIQ